MNRRLSRCIYNCGIRVNTAIASLVPVFDAAKEQIPLLKEYLPENIYGYAFFALVVVNVVLHFRVPVDPPK